MAPCGGTNTILETLMIQRDINLGHFWVFFSGCFVCLFVVVSSVSWCVGEGGVGGWGEGLGGGGVASRDRTGDRRKSQ